jgi:hypothetical protein
MPTSRRQRLQPEPVGPDWLERLRAAIFAVYPALDTAAVLGEEPVLCKRSLMALGESVRYHETYLDPRTYEVKRSWYVDFQTAAFVGQIPQSLFTVHVTLALRVIAERQAGLTAAPRERPMTPEQFTQWVTGRGVRA